ncbi:MAG: NAD/NADP octopine/nopaline dehydrogenase family protein [Acidisphaera sp.]|nr:NAD/NADP octopine/nopaline dehydrogenase family protein [Acidisphaera sp.]
MRVAVLGAGAIAFGNAALLCRNGHDPILWSPSGRRTAALASGAPLEAEGAVAGRFHPRVARDCAEALADAEAVLVALPGNGHRLVMDAAAPHLHPGQVVLISSHMSLSALYLAGLLAPRGVAVPIVGWGTTVTTGRQPGPTQARVSNIRAKVDIATLPTSAAAQGLAVCEALFGKRFVPRADLLAVSLSNLNPQNHLAMALCNFTRIERGESWANWSGATEAVGRLMTALDAERLAVAAAFGYEVRTITEHFTLSFGVTPGTVGEMAQQILQRDTGLGPATPETRYITEDVPFGLVPTVRLAGIAGVPVPLHAGGVAIFSALYGRDFAAENDILPALGLDALSIDGLRAKAEGVS